MTVQDPQGRALSTRLCSQTLEPVLDTLCPTHGSADCVETYWSERRLGQLPRRQIDRRWRDEWRPRSAEARPARPASKARWRDIDELYRAGLIAAGCAALAAVGFGLVALITWSVDFAVVAAMAGALALMTGLVNGLAAADDLAREARRGALARARTERGWEA